MDVIQRPLSELEQKIVNLQYLYCCEKLKEVFNWKRGLFMATAVVVVIGLMIKIGFDWFLGIILVSFVVGLYYNVKAFFEDKQKYQKNKEILSELIENDSIKVIECKASRVLFFPDYDDEGAYYLFEVGEKRLMCYHQTYSEVDFLIPNDHFKFYSNDKIKEVLGLGLELLGDRMAPITVLGEMKLHLFDTIGFPGHLAIIEMSIENFLDKAKESMFKE